MRLLKDNPSLAGDFLLESVPDAYEEAKEKVSEETTIFLENFPAACPYTVEQLLAKDWLPRS